MTQVYHESLLGKDEMTSPLLTTKLYIPPPRPNLVPRPHLVERLDESLRLGHKLTLVSAPAGFGKTTLLSEWIADCGRPIAWVSLDEGDNDPIRFLTYLVGALRTAMGFCGAANIKEMHRAEMVIAPSIATEGKSYQMTQGV